MQRSLISKLALGTAVAVMALGAVACDDMEADGDPGLQNGGDLGEDTGGDLGEDTGGDL